MITDDLLMKMSRFDAGNPKRIQHFVKVYSLTHLIGVREGLDAQMLRILDMASILHDIGIRPAEEKYGRCDGPLQEKEGPAYARAMLSSLTSDIPTAEEIGRVCWLIAHHHTYDPVCSIDHRILLEADFLVNAFEGQLGTPEILTFRQKVFRTPTGTDLLNTMFGLLPG